MNYTQNLAKFVCTILNLLAICIMSDEALINRNYKSRTVYLNKEKFIQIVLPFVIFSINALQLYALHLEI